ncbi:formate/nitrite transporter family protein [uncultured Cetobacterium sp.]|uniref:formate/nitrite transporter family protein n=1 Tax=uncultured Cetobacterium sp. TaxID=527638 RepID=UPI00260A9AAD|nr:formate/nitrite transporter family protein [uncultured Cetobacterium sp.]
MKVYLTNKETTEQVLLLGENKGHYSFTKTMLLGLMGGVYIALSALGNLIANFTIGGGAGKFVGACVFPTGLMLVVLVGGSLFTGDCLGLLAFTKGKVEKVTYIKNLCAVWIGNLIGSVFIAYVTYLGGSYSSIEFSNYVVGVAQHKVHLGFIEAIASGFLCNVLVAIGVWFALASKDLAGKILAIWFPIMLFILGGFQHVVANMYYLSIGKILMTSAYSFGGMGVHFLAVTIGNFLSGALFLPLIYKKLYMND